MAYIEINKNNFFDNLNQFLKKIKNINKIGIVLKDNAYGHGIELISKLSQEFGLQESIVKNIKEAKIVEKYFNNILILNDKAIFNKKFSFSLNSLEDIMKAEKYSKVELKINTGMNRNGIEVNQIDKALYLIKKYNLNLKGVLTHFGNADEDNSDIFDKQNKFNNIKEKIIKLGYKNIRFHSCNSSASFRLNITNEDFIRIGIGAYGYSEFKNYKKFIQLKPILSLWADKISTKYIKKNETVGYGTNYILFKDMKISLYNIGYGDGLIINNITSIDNLKPIIGRLSMDFLSIEGDEKKICIFRDLNKNINRNKNIISYEVLTKLNENIKKIVV